MRWTYMYTSTERRTRSRERIPLCSNSVAASHPVPSSARSSEQSFRASFRHRYSFRCRSYDPHHERNLSQRKNSARCATCQAPRSTTRNVKWNGPVTARTLRRKYARGHPTMTARAHPRNQSRRPAVMSAERDRDGGAPPTCGDIMAEPMSAPAPKRSHSRIAGVHLSVHHTLAFCVNSWHSWC